MSRKPDIELSQTQRDELEHLVRAGNAPARTQTRARILLLSDRSQGPWRSAPKVAEAVMVHPNTVRNVRRRFVAEGLAAALQEKPRPGATPKLDGELEARLTVLACSAPPAGQRRWTLRLLAEQLVALEYVDEVSHVTVGEWLKKTHLSLGA
jgi:transposase